jgi:uncharacterized membrane protein
MNSPDSAISPRHAQTIIHNDSPEDQRGFEKHRLVSVDLVRGWVMVLMALDHVRWFFTDATFDPTDLEHTTAALFLTRWMTHFCAPAFIFLAGASAFLSTQRGTSRPALTRHLLARGLWLILLEMTVVHLAWSFRFDFEHLHLGVLWAIGWSMVAMAGLIYLPLPALAILGTGMITTHNLVDGLNLESFNTEDGSLSAIGWLISALHIPHPPISYPLIPWVGVMMMGYAFGPILQMRGKSRHRVPIAAGVTLLGIFLVLRMTNAYGDPTPWSIQSNPLFSVLSVLNTRKYPPSLLYLLMTLGPTLLALAWSPRHPGPFARCMVTFGRVPLFFYLAHLYLIHGLVLLIADAQNQDLTAYLTSFSHFPARWGFSLPVVYGIWLGVVLLLYPLCRIFAGIKAKHHGSRWTGYI